MSKSKEAEGSHTHALFGLVFTLCFAFPLFQAPDKVFRYMSQQNRPYSVVDIFNNLHKEFGKTVCTIQTI